MRFKSRYLTCLNVVTSKSMRLLASKMPLARFLDRFTSGPKIPRSKGLKIFYRPLSHTYAHDVCLLLFLLLPPLFLLRRRNSICVLEPPRRENSGVPRTVRLPSEMTRASISRLTPACETVQCALELLTAVLVSFPYNLMRTRR